MYFPPQTKNLPLSDRAPQPDDPESWAFQGSIKAAARHLAPAPAPLRMIAFARADSSFNKIVPL